MDDGTYIAFLLVGIVVVVADAMIIYRGGLRYLGNSYAEAGTARSMARLVAALFAIAVLGVLALISAVDVGGDTAAQAIVLRLGIVLILVAIAHGITIKILTRMRDRLDAENKTKQHYGTQTTPPVRPAGRSSTPKVRDVRP